MKTLRKSTVRLLLFAGACFLVCGLVDLIRVQQARPIQEIARISFLAWDRRALIQQHEGEVIEVVEETVTFRVEVNGLSDEDAFESVREVSSGEGGALLINPAAETVSDRASRAHQDGAAGQKGALESKGPRISLGGINLRHGLDKAPADPVALTSARRDRVRAAMMHAWSSYEKYAWGSDELAPLSQSGENKYGALGVTILESLDTLYIMGLHAEFERACEWVAASLDFNKSTIASVAATTTKVIGGLLSAYDLSGKAVLRNKAQELAERLLPAWDTETGIPMDNIDHVITSGLESDPGSTTGSSTLADIGSGQVEFLALTARTLEPRYFKTVGMALVPVFQIFPSDGLLPDSISPHSGKPTSKKFSFGAKSGTFYATLLKLWIAVGAKSPSYQLLRDLWDQSMEGLLSLVRRPYSDHPQAYIAQRNGDRVLHVMDEAACFAPGMLALGSEHASPAKARQYLDTADKLVQTCYDFYFSTNTFLASENTIRFTDGEPEMSIGTNYNPLGGKTIESLFYLWRKTGDAKYRDLAWDIFQIIEDTRLQSGYVGLATALEPLPTMDSFFMANILKYLYLLYSPSSVMPLDEWVFNSDGHPIKIVPPGMSKSKAD